MAVLKENIPLLELTNINTWNNKGYDGSLVHIVIFDKKGSPHDHIKDYASAPLCPKTTISHGTNVASVINQFSKCKITMLYSNDECREYFKTIADTVDIVNISMSADKQLAEHSWGFLKDYDIPVFCSSGNDGDDEINYPSAFDWTISVGAWSKGRIVDYSNYSNSLDCVGITDVYVANSEKKSFKFNGTSCSSPQVASTFSHYAHFIKQNYSRKVTRQEAFDFVHKNCIETKEDEKDGYGLFVLPIEIPVIEKQPIPPIQVEPEKPKKPEIINPKPIEDPKDNNGDDIKMPKYKVALNAGHGMKNNGVLDVGAVGATGYKEYIQTKELTDLVDTKLKYNGIGTLVIQDGDLWDVTNLADNWGADYFVSIHCNSVANPTAHGVETFALSSGGNGEKLAKAIHKELIPTTGLYDRGVKFANYHVLRETNMSACLTEVGFISNPKEQALMKDPVWDNKVASGIAKGICNFLNISYKEPSSPPYPTPSPSSNVMYRILIDSKQIMALSSQESAITELKRRIDSSSTAQKGIVQRTDNNLVVFEHTKLVKSGKIIVTIYPEDDRIANYYADYLGDVEVVNVKEMTSAMWSAYEDIIQIGGQKHNSNVTLLLSGNDAFDTIVEVLKYMYGGK